MSRLTDYQIAGLQAELNGRPTEPKWPDPLHEDALMGLPGMIVRTIEPESEADPAAILLQLLAAAGSAIGNRPGFRVEADRHGTNVYVLLVGKTSKGRKGSSWGHPRRLVGEADPSWVTRVVSGLSSGEGVIDAVRDPRYSLKRARGQDVTEANDEGYIEVLEDEGVEDKRLLAYESEFASVLRVMRRDGSTLSSVIRNGWDRGDLRTLTKNSPTKATGAHISIVGHIGDEELRRELSQTDAASGFGNRFLFVCATRSKELPHGGNVPDEAVREMASELAVAIRFARKVDEITRSDKANRLWEEVYHDLSEGGPGMHGAITGRAEAQVVRLSNLYALLDQSSVVKEPHLRAALAVWNYCDESAAYIFGSALGDDTADTIDRALRRAGAEGLTRTEISGLFKRHKTAAEIDRALDRLVRLGRAECRTEQSGGRPVERWVHCEISEESEITPPEKGEKGLSSHISLISQPDTEAVSA